jgi:hypothetical protein
MALWLEPGNVSSLAGLAVAKLRGVQAGVEGEGPSVPVEEELRSIIGMLDDVLARAPHYLFARVARGGAHLLLGEREGEDSGSLRKALEDYRMAREVRPWDWRLVANVAQASLSLASGLERGPAEAEELLKEAWSTLDAAVGPGVQGEEQLRRIRAQVCHTLARMWAGLGRDPAGPLHQMMTDVEWILTRRPGDALALQLHAAAETISEEMWR